MSLFYLNVRILNRSKQSAVAAAAYRSGEKLYSERDMETKNYRTREVSPESFIMAPDGAPEWANDREKLWNEVEKKEKHIRSQLAREIKIALPIELSDDLQRKLLTGYVQKNFVDKGMVADVSIHRDKKNNPHAHIMLTMRPFLENGQWGNKKKKVYDRDKNGNYILDKKGKPRYKTYFLTDWDKKDNVLIWRKDWANAVNRYYEREGVNEYISEKSYKEQGLDKFPKHRLTLEDYRLEKKLEEKAKREGDKFTPNSYFAQLNQKIDLLNKAIELRKQKVVELNEYKKAIQKDHDELNKIRNISSLSSEDQDAVRAVGQHMKQFVDLETAERNMENMRHFKINVEKKYYAAVGLDNFLARVKKDYVKNPQLIRGYGFDPANYESDRKMTQREKDQVIDDYLKLKNSFDHEWKQGEKALEVQKQFTEKEFAYLYPEINNKLSMTFSDNLNRDYAVKIKADYVKQFRENGTLVSEIPEFKPGNQKLQKEYADLGNIKQRLQQNRADLTVLKRTINKRMNEYSDLVKNHYDKEKVKRSSISYLTVYNQFEDKKKERADLNNAMNRLVTSIYPREDQIAVNDLPVNDKLDLVQMHLDGTGSNDFRGDSEVVHALNEKKNADHKAKIQHVRNQKAADWNEVRSSLNQAVYRQLSGQERQSLIDAEKILGERPTLENVQQRLQDADRRFEEISRKQYELNTSRHDFDNFNHHEFVVLKDQKGEIITEKKKLNTAIEALGKLNLANDRLDQMEKQYKAEKPSQGAQEKSQASIKGFIEQGLKAINDAFMAAQDEQDKNKRKKKRNRSEIKYRGKDNQDQPDR